MNVSYLSLALASLLAGGVVQAQDAHVAQDSTHSDETKAAASTQAATSDWFGVPATARALYPNLRVDEAVRAVTPRIVFNAMPTPGRPPVPMPIVHCTGRLFTDESWTAYTIRAQPDAWRLIPDERRVRMAAVEAQQRRGALCLDIEAFPLDSRNATNEEIDRSIQTIAKMVGWAREQSPGIRVFLYSMMPHTDTITAIEHHIAATTQPSGDTHAWWMAKKPEIDSKYAAWQRANARMRSSDGVSVGLSTLFDAVCPALYLAKREPAWSEAEIVGLVRAHVDEARQYGKSVYPFVWPHFYRSAEPVDLQNWVTLMREISLHADGMILWDEPDSKWDFPTTLRVRIANLLASRKGILTDRDIYDALKTDFPNYAELERLNVPGR